VGQSIFVRCHAASSVFTSQGNLTFLPSVVIADALISSLLKFTNCFYTVWTTLAGGPAFRVLCEGRGCPGANWKSRREFKRIPALSLQKQEEQGQATPSKDERERPGHPPYLHTLPFWYTYFDATYYGLLVTR
jgi:hypothetical protein